MSTLHFEVARACVTNVRFFGDRLVLTEYGITVRQQKVVSNGALKCRVAPTSIELQIRSV
jgi:hypothetical protein